MTTFAQQAIAFNQHLSNIEQHVKVQLPENYAIMNPFQNGEALAISSDFYRKFYNDSKPRRLILGINPGRNGAGLTGVAFTDSKQLEKLNIDSRGIQTHETSAVFVYKMIEALGSVKGFYQQFYFNSPLPLGLLVTNTKGNQVNANYYDNKTLTQSMLPLINHSIKHYQTMSLDLTTVYCLGQGQNFKFLQQWNNKNKVFGTIVALAHPRYIMQYKTKYIDEYIQIYRKALLG